MARKDPKPPKAPKAPKPAGTSRRAQLMQTYTMAKKGDPKLGFILFAVFVVAAVVGFAVFWILPPDGGWISWVFSVIGAVLIGTLATLLVFGRRAQSSMYKQMEGQLGAGAASLKMLGRGWEVTEVVAFNRQQDVVHRAVGKPGIVLIGEGDPKRLQQLLTAERRKHDRVTVGTPIHDAIVGRGEGQVPLPKLVKHVKKLPKALHGADVTDVLHRLKAIDAQRGKMPLPKGPLPTNAKGMRQAMRGR